MEGSEIAATPAAPEVSAAPAAPIAPAPVESAPPTDAALPNEQPQIEESAAVEPESTQDFIKKGLAEIWGTAAETENPQDTPTVVEGVTETETGTEQTEQTNPTISEYAPGKFEILSADELNEKFNRAPIAIREYALAASEEAKIGRELTQKLGGEFFIEPITEIAQGIQNGENLGIFQGILKAGGVDSFAEMIDDVMTLALIDTQKNEPTNDGERFMQARCKEITDQILQNRFGENASIERIEELLKYDRDGYLNADDVRKYYEEDGDGENNPVIESLKQQVETLKGQLGEQTTSESEKQNAIERAANEKFTELSDQSLSKTMNDLVYQDSVIKPLETDSPEVKNAKETVKNLIDSFISNKFKTGSYGDLKNSFKKGNQNTATFQSKFSEHLNSTVLEAKDLISGIEAMFAANISNSRNNQLLTKTTPGNPEIPNVPTETTAPKSTAQMSDEEYHEWLKQGFAQL